MNKSRREELKEQLIILNSSASRLESIKDDEDDARSNMPENLESSEQYEASEECSDAIENAIDSVNEAIKYIEDVI